MVKQCCQQTEVTPKTMYVVLCTILERQKQLCCLIISSLQKIKEKEIWTLQKPNKITR